jgi:hypothetical protein
MILLQGLPEKRGTLFERSVLGFNPARRQGDGV